jgi:DNA-binding MarR family transcriptional regulator
MDRPRWLDADEQRVWRTFLTSTQLLLEQLDRQLLRDSGMPHAYYGILVALSEAPGRSLRMSELAEVTCSSRSRLSHAVGRLEEKGWACRTECPTDRRGQLATLTDAGLDALAAAAAGHVEEVRRQLFDQLTAEQVSRLGEISEILFERLATEFPAAARRIVEDGPGPAVPLTAGSVPISLPRTSGCSTGPSVIASALPSGCPSPPPPAPAPVVPPTG